MNRATPSLPLARHLFGYGCHRQTWWNWRIGAAFFLGEIGGGVFLISLLTGDTIGLVVGYATVVLGKNTAHLLYLGRPERFWRAAMRPDRSWIARGIWATGIFSISGLIAILARTSLIAAPAALTTATSYLAAAAALFIMFYDGLVMRASPSIAFWRTGLLPILCLTYAALGGTTLCLLLERLRDTPMRFSSALMDAELLLLMVNATLLLIYMEQMRRWTPAARETVRSLLEGAYAKFFLGFVLAIGIVATFVLATVHKHVQAPWLAGLIATCELIGDFTLMMVLLKSGLFAAQTAPGYNTAGERRATADRGGLSDPVFTIGE